MNNSLDALKYAVREALNKSRLSGEHIRYSAKGFSKNLAKIWFFPTGVDPESDHTAASGSYIFVFHKNASVTNMQYQEIGALISRFSKLRDSKKHHTTIMTTNKAVAFISGLAESFEFFEKQFSTKDVELEAAKTAFVETLVLFYSDFFLRTIVVDKYYTTACVHVPISIRLDVFSIVGASGYIHSAGPKIYIRNIDKSSVLELKNALSVAAVSDGGKKMFVVPYANEFFDENDRFSPYSIRNGLEGIKFRLRKHYIGKLDFITFLDMIRRDLSNHIYIYDGSTEFTRARRAAVEQHDCEPRWSIWITTDNALSSDGKLNRGSQADQKYLIAYLQCIKSANEFLVFKERKPGWTAPITYPHTLSASMLNLCIGNMSNTSQKVFMDPFNGTGTTLFDTALRTSGSTFIGLDRDSAYIRILLLNYEFMRLDRTAREKLKEDLETAKSIVSNEDFADSGSMEKLLLAKPMNKLEGIVDIKSTVADLTKISLSVISSQLYTAILSTLFDGNETGEDICKPVVAGVDYIFNNGFGDEFWKYFEQQTNLTFKFFILLFWRGIANNRFEITDEFIGILSAVGKELDVFLRELKERESGSLVGSAINPHEKLSRSIANTESGFSMMIDDGVFSKTSCFTSNVINERCAFNVVKQAELKSVANASSSGNFVCQVNDSLEAISSLENSIDVIICDPPYGFNTKEGGLEDLRQFYSKMLGVFVRSLKPKGQIIMTVPLFAKNGKRIPLFASKEYLDYQFVNACSIHSKTPGKPTLVSALEMDSAFKTDLYWRSTSALDRSILWYNIL